MIRQNNELMANAFENSSRQMTAHQKKKMQNVVFHESTQSLWEYFLNLFFFSVYPIYIGPLWFYVVQSTNDLGKV